MGLRSCMIFGVEELRRSEGWKVIVEYGSGLKKVFIRMRIFWMMGGNGGKRV